MQIVIQSDLLMSSKFGKIKACRPGRIRTRQETRRDCQKRSRAEVFRRGLNMNHFDLRAGIENQDLVTD